MPKLQVNDDGTITFPLRGREPLTLDEPSMADLAWLTGEVQRADSSLPQLPPLPRAPEKPTQEQIDAWNDANQQRTLAVYDPAEGVPPYGALIIELIKRAHGAEVTPDQLYGWAASPGTVRTVLEHFRDPLPGQAS